MSFAFAERGPPGPLLRALILEEDALKAVHPHHDLPPDSDAAVVPRHQGETTRRCPRRPTQTSSPGTP